jgi:hypothetical protein
MQLVIVVELNDKAQKKPMEADKLGRRLRSEVASILNDWTNHKHYEPASLAEQISYELQGLEVPMWIRRDNNG